MVMFEEMQRAVEAAAPEKLAAVASAMAQAYGAGGLTDEQYEQLDGLLAARRRVAKAAPVGMQTLATACAQQVPAVAPPQEWEGATPTHADTPTEVCCTVQPTSARAHHRTGSRPRSAESATRRRRWAAAGYLPPKLAAAFTPGEQAVLAVVAMEIGKRGTCTLAVGHMAALAGVCATVAKRALRQARTLGLINVEERRLTGFRNDTNVVRVASQEWAGWLRLRMPRASHARLQVIGGTVVPSTCIRASSKGTQTHFRPEQGPIAGPNRTTRPAARTAGA